MPSLKGCVTCIPTLVRKNEEGGRGRQRQGHICHWSWINISKFMLDQDETWIALEKTNSLNLNTIYLQRGGLHVRIRHILLIMVYSYYQRQFLKFIWIFLPLYIIYYKDKRSRKCHRRFHAFYLYILRLFHD